MFPAEYGGVASVVVMQCCMGKHVDLVYVKLAVASLVIEEHMICGMSLQLYTCAHRSSMRI